MFPDPFVVSTLIVAIILVLIAATYILFRPIDRTPYGILAVAAIFLFANKLLLGMYIVALLDVGLFVWNAYLFLTITEK